MKANQTPYTNIKETWHRTIRVDYLEEKWSDTCEKFTTTITVSGVPLLHTAATNLLGLLKDPDKYGSIHNTLERLKSLLVPQGQEVTLRDFSNPPEHDQQVLTFVTICDHGD